jgi:hypothetical protein
MTPNVLLAPSFTDEIIKQPTSHRIARRACPVRVKPSIIARVLGGAEYAVVPFFPTA